MNIVMGIAILIFACALVLVGYCAKKQISPFFTALMFVAFIAAGALFMTYSAIYQYGVDRGISPSVLPTAAALNEHDLTTLTRNVEPCVANTVLLKAEGGNAISLISFEDAQVACEKQKLTSSQARVIEEGMVE